LSRYIINLLLEEELKRKKKPEKSDAPDNNLGTRPSSSPDYYCMSFIKDLDLNVYFFADFCYKWLLTVFNGLSLK
jgi:hypothetical protein